MRKTWRSIPYKPSHVFGLTKEPLLESCLCRIDWWEEFEDRSGYDLREKREKPGIYGEFILHFETLKQIIIKNPIFTVMEIGVHRTNNTYKSSTIAILEALSRKKNSTFYLGIDLEEKHFLEQQYDNCLTIKTSSDNQYKIRKTLEERDISQLDLLLIDGDHSIEMMINDWKYADLLREGGLVIFHDVSFHPGPKLIYQCIDEKLFEKTAIEIPGDWGFALCRRRYLNE
ncbi:MAG: class I SAM-dependent methyltransferase [Symploca sp. SIO3C6]|nr:class I SAM-dependent methyltransferase [Symploca sp. SIO3C6]